MEIERNDFSNTPIPKSSLIISLLFLFFIGGLVIGCLLGIAYADHKWDEYHDEINNQLAFCTGKADLGWPFQGIKDADNLSKLGYG